jgi:hypothetical protein
MSSEYLAPVWDLSPKFLQDNSTNEFKWTEQRSTSEPSTSQDTIKINLDDTNSYMLFSKAMVEVNFTVSSTTPLTEADGVSIPNAFGLFDEVRLQMNNKLIQTIPFPGMLHHMVQQQAVSKDYADSVSETSLFFPIKKRDFRGLPAIPAPLTGATVASTITAQQVIDHNTLPQPRDTIATTNGSLIWFPIHDSSAALQSEYLSDGTNLTTTGRVRKNPDYDEYYEKSALRVLENGRVLSCWLPLCEIYPLLKHSFSHVMRGSRFELQFNKATEMNSVFHCKKAVPGLTFAFTKVSLWVPRLNPSLESEAQIEAQIASMPELSNPYEKCEIIQHTFGGAVGTAENRVRLTTQSARPLRMYVGFQKAAQRAGLSGTPGTVQPRNPVQFEGLNLETIGVRINGEPYPVETYATNSKLGLIRMLHDIHYSNGKVHDYENGSVVDYDSFANGAQRVYMFDLTQLDDGPFKRANTMDLEIRYRLSNAVQEVPAGSVLNTAAQNVDYTVWAVVVSEGVLNSSQLNGKMLITQA